MSILLFGGRFDCIHNGHLFAARTVMEELNFKEVIFIPAKNPPHKPAVASFEDRIEMVKLAIAGEKGFDFSAEDQTYTIETIHLFRKAGYRDIHWLIGSDNIPEISKWRSAKELMEICKFVVANRPGETGDIPNGMKVINCSVTGVPHSSTEIRERVKRGRSIRYMVPERVAEYIKNKKLYKD